MRYLKLAVMLMLAVGATGASSFAQEEKAKAEPKRPALGLRALAGSGMVPVRVQFVAELRGGDNDFAEYYCPGVEWVWGDGTVSESSEDCEPYEAGKIEIRRRYSVAHNYSRPGRVSVQFRLKQKDRVVGSATTVVQLVGSGF